MTIIMFGMVFTGLLAIFAIFLHGNSTFLIIGYRAMSKEKQERYNEEALCRCVIWMFAGASYGVALIPVGIQLLQPWLIGTGIALALLLPTGLTVYANTGGHFLRGKSKQKRQWHQSAKNKNRH